jgi:hypothetical protein
MWEQVVVDLLYKVQHRNRHMCPGKHPPSSIILMKKTGNSFAATASALVASPLTFTLQTFA